MIDKTGPQGQGAPDPKATPASIAQHRRAM